MAPSRGLLLGRYAINLSISSTLKRPSWAHKLFSADAKAQFHTTRAHSSGLIETSVGAVHDGISFLHSTLGLPWYLALPLTAVVLRTTVVLPLQVIAQQNRRQRASLTPKVLEARPDIERMIITKYNHLGPEKCTRLLSWELVKKREQLRKEAGIGRWQIWAPWAQFPVWLLAIETIRRMAGASEGLLGLFSGRESKEKATSNSGEAETQFLPTNTDIGGLVENVADSSTLVSGDKLYSSPIFEPSLSTGGCLWFPDLLAPDPMLILPFTLSAILFASVSWEERLVEAAGIRRPRWSIGLTRSVKIVALAIGPLTLQMPAALMVYWVSSASTALAQKAIVDMLVPIDRTALSDSKSTTRDKSGISEATIDISASRTKKYVPMKRAPKRR